MFKIKDGLRLGSNTIIDSEANLKNIGSLVINGSLISTNEKAHIHIDAEYPTIQLNDINADSFYIHANSNNFYILSDRDGPGTYGNWDGTHPMQLEADTGAAYLFGSRAFTDAYHPNADKWTTARTITLGGDLTGSVSLDGSSNVTLSAQVVNNSHTHDDRYARAQYLGQANIDDYRADGLYEFDPIPTGTPPIQSPNLRVLMLGNDGRTTQMAFNYATDQAWFRRKHNTTWHDWREFIHSGNIGSQSVNYATSAGNADTVDSLHASSFIRSDANDSASGSISFTNSYYEFGNSTGSVSNDGGWNARLNLAGSQHARLDVKSVSDGIITSMYSHTGQGVGKVGTMSNHPTVLMVNGSEYARVDTNGLDALALGVTNSAIDTGRGLSLYGGATSGMPTFGIAFAGTATFGNHGGVTSDWATYFTMSDSATRGWIFKRGSTNVASIDGGGDATFSGTLNVINGYQLNGTTVIDSSRNLTNIGTGSFGGTITISNGNLDIRTQNEENPTDVIYLGANNGNSGGSSNDVGTGIVFAPKYTGYTKRSAGIMQIGEGNYFRSGLAFYTNNTANASTDWSERMRLDMDGNLIIGDAEYSYLTSDNTYLVGSKTNARLHVNGGIQLKNNNDAIVFGRGTSTFLKDEELGFGWGGGLYMTDGTWLRTRNNKGFYNGTGTIRTDGAYDVGGTTVIDSNRNLTNIGTIGASNFAKDSSGRIAVGHSNTTTYMAGTSGTSVYHANYPALGLSRGSSSRSLLYMPNATQMRIWIESNDVVDFHTDKVNMHKPLQIGGTTVIDSSRNLTNISAGSFSSYVSADNLRASNYLMLQDAYKEIALGWFNFGNNDPNNFIDIIFECSNYWGMVEVEITSSYSYQNACGSLIKRFAVGHNGSNSSYGGGSEELVSDTGHLSNSIRIGSVTRSGSNFIIPINKYTSTNNNFEVRVKLFSIGYSSNTNVYLGSKYSGTNLTREYTPFKHIIGNASSTTFGGGTYKANLGSASFSWDGNTTYPTLYGSHADRWVMMTFPHIPYLNNGQRGYTGTTVGSVTRYEAWNGQHYDSGILSRIGDGRFSISRNDLSTPSITAYSANATQHNVNVGGTNSPWNSANRSTLTINGQNNSLLGFTYNGGNSGYVYAYGSTMEMLAYGELKLLSNNSSSYYGKLNTGVWNVSHGYQVAGTTVIDSSRDMYPNVIDMSSGHAQGYKFHGRSFSWNSSMQSPTSKMPHIWQEDWSGWDPVIGIKTQNGFWQMGAYTNDIIHLGYMAGAYGTHGTNAFDQQIQFHKDGGIVASGNITAYSDVTLKDNITNIDNALEKVNSIRGVTYDRIDQDNARHAGVIAQEVEEVLPEVVHTDDDGIKSVAYGNMVGLLIEAIKEQQTQINELQAQIKEIKGE